MLSEVNQNKKYKTYFELMLSSATCSHVYRGCGSPPGVDVTIYLSHCFQRILGELQISLHNSRNNASSCEYTLEGSPRLAPRFRCWSKGDSTTCHYAIFVGDPEKHVATLQLLNAIQRKQKLPFILPNRLLPSHCTCFGTIRRIPKRESGGQ